MGGGNLKARPAWHETLACGFPEMDGQHQHLLEAAGCIASMLEADPGREGLPQAIQALVRQLGAHHQEEERFMRWLSFPELEAHRAQHRGQVVRLEALHALVCRSRGACEVEALLLAVIADTARHIVDEDRAIGSFALGRVTSA